MKLSEAIQQAANEPDRFRRRELVRQVADFMRWKCGWNYLVSRKVVTECGVTEDQWEELLYEADQGE